jgi:hypothetical protein
MVSGTGISPTGSVRETTELHNRMVSMTRGYIPRSAINSTKEGYEGVFELKHLTAKSHALFLSRMRVQRLRPGTVTAEWLRKLGLTGMSRNTQFRDRILATMEYLRRFAVDSASLAERGPTESKTVYKHRVYDTMHQISMMELGPREMRITILRPNTAWPSVWKNLAETPVTEETKAA